MKIKIKRPTKENRTSKFRIKSLKQLLSMQAQKFQVESAWSCIDSDYSKLRKKFCDITGLPACYTDPGSGLHYSSPETQKFIKQLPPSLVQKYISIRNEN